MLVKVKVFSEPTKRELLQEMTYIIESFEVVFGGRRAQEIEQDVADVDPKHEYLVLNCADDYAGKMHAGTVKEVYEDHIIVSVPDISEHMWYANGLNMDEIYPDYNF